MWVLEFNDDDKNAVISNTAVYHLLCYMAHTILVAARRGMLLFPFLIM